jgi:lipoprotein signal peptidase
LHGLPFCANLHSVPTELQKPSPIHPYLRRSWAQEVLLLLGVTLMLAGADQYTKGWVVERQGGLSRDRTGRMRPRPGTEPLELVPGALRLTLTANEGAIWGIGRAWRPGLKRGLFITLSVVAVGFVLLLFAGTSEAQWLRRLGLSAVMAGAVGNLLDRIFLDYVVDFIDWYWGFRWPTYNVADAAITVGVLLVVIDLLWHPDGPEPASPAP